jgi:hypothetical protein
MAPGAVKRIYTFSKNACTLGEIEKVLRAEKQLGAGSLASVRVQVYFNGSVKQIDVVEERTPGRVLKEKAAGDPVYPNKDDGTGRVSYIHGSPVQHPSFRDTPPKVRPDRDA